MMGANMTPEFVQGLLAGAVILNGIGTFILASTIKNLVKEIYNERTPPLPDPNHKYETARQVGEALKQSKPEIQLVPKSEETPL